MSFSEPTEFLAWHQGCMDGSESQKIAALLYITGALVRQHVLILFFSVPQGA